MSVTVNELLHPSVKRLLEAEPGASTPEEALICRVHRLIDETREFGWSGPPFDIHILASLSGFRVHTVSDLPNSADACIAGRVITVARTTRVRERFSIAHELCHTLFPDYGRTDVPRFWRYRFDAQSPVEQLCQLGASELLMPADAFLAHTSGAPILTHHNIENTRETFRVSIEAAIRRYAHLSNGRSIALMLYYGHKPSEHWVQEQVTLFDVEPPRKLRILYCSGTTLSNAAFIPRYKSIPQRSAAYRVFDTGEAATSLEDWSDIHGLHICRFHGFSSQIDGQTSVICLLETAV